MYCATLFVLRSDKGQWLSPGKSIKTDYKMNMTEPSGYCYITTLIWAIVNIDVHICNNKQVFASVVYINLHTVIF